MRIARSIAPGVVYHVISRFVEGEWRLREAEERQHYLRLFGRAVRESDWRSIAFALMSNHIHHGLVAGQTPLERLFKRVHCPFANWINERHGRIGPVFAERPAIWAVRPENVPHLIAYIHANPVRAGVVREPHESSWTSARAYASGGTDWLAVAYARELCGDRVGDSALFPLPDDEGVALAGIHREARKSGALELATPTQAPLEVPIVARPFARVRPRPLDIIAAAARVLLLQPEQVRSRSTHPRVSSAKRIAIHAGVRLGVTASDLGAALGISRQAAARTARRVLERLECAAVDVICDVLTEFTASPPNAADLLGAGGTPG